MKKSIYFGALLLAVLTSCTKENSQGIEVDGQHSFRINTTAPCLETDDADTKASMKATVRLQWNDGDEISVVNLSTGKTMLGNLTAKVNGDKVSFEGELSGSIKAGNKMAAIYPCQNYSGITNVPDFALDLSKQTCTTKDDLKFAAYSLFDCKTTGVVEVTSNFVVPVSFNQITLATIDPETKIDYVELTNVGNGISFHVNSSDGKLEITPSVGKVRITPQSKLSEKNGALFAYCALAESPASSRAVTVKALPKIYYATWAESAMSASKFYTSIASDFETQEYKDFMVSAPSSLEVGYLGGTVSFSVTSNNIDWTASATPSLNITPSSGKGCENLEVVVTVPQNDETAERSFLVTLSGGSEEYHFTINQKADPHKEIIAFADINLKKYMLPLFDEDEDGEINVLEAENVQNVNCSEKNIADLSGLEKCPNLKYLNCNGNYISEIILPNLSKLETIVAYGNPIEKIDVNNDAALATLKLQNVSTNALSGTGISIVGYDQAETLSLDFSGTKYTSLTIKNSTVLTSYDVAKNVQLTKLYLCGNSLVKDVDVSSLSALTTLHVWGCALESLDVDANVNLESLMCYNNKLSTLNLDNNTALKTLNASNNILTNLKLQNNIALTNVNVENNKLQSLNVRKCIKLGSLNVGNNPDITALALGYNTSLQTLKAHNTGLTDIDLSSNINLLELDLNGCSGVKVIDLSANTLLEKLNLSSTSIITTIDVSVNLKLKDVDVSSTEISSLDLSNHTSLTTLNASNNPYLSTLNVSNSTCLVTLKVSTKVKLIVSKGLKSSIYQIGQYINIDGEDGIAYSNANIISIDESSQTWYGDAITITVTGASSSSDGTSNTNMIASKSPAAQWCRSKGSDWYLPAINEWKEIYKVKSTLNSVLSQISGTKFKTGEYWSSTEDKYEMSGGSWRSTSAYIIWFYDGSTDTAVKNNSRSVRAVRAL